MKTLKEHHPILFETLKGKAGNLGLITLNRPDQLNALSPTMFEQLDQQIKPWLDDPSIKAVIIRGAGERGFCAGGDLKHIHQHYHDRHTLLPPSNLFYHEYRTNEQIFHTQKPYIALMHGITMGGGVGISLHGTHRIGAPGLRFAMPETSIGFYPDAGASYFLSRCPDYLGLYLGLTGVTLDEHDAAALQLIDYIIPHTQFDHIIESLRSTDLGNPPHHAVHQLLAPLAKPAQPPSLSAIAKKINHYFKQPSIPALLKTLKENNNDAWAASTLRTLQQKSPISLFVTLKQWQRGQTMDFNACMEMEYTLSQRFLQQPNFIEGIRALLIDKDRSPQWQPATFNSITPEAVDQYFNPRGLRTL